MSKILTSLFLILFLSSIGHAELRELSDLETSLIGEKIWMNECNQTIAGLLSWNNGEKFASLGIGHFIWYPLGRRGHFVETFPELIAFFQKHDVTLPGWLTPQTACLWHSKEEFEKNKKSPKMKELHTLLVKTIPLQALFMAKRLEKTVPILTQDLPSADATHVEVQIKRLAKTTQGMYALIDYLNFKGDGTNLSERYGQHGWGLLQVLLKMPGNTENPLEEFTSSAKKVLINRVDLAPKERNENRWLNGWLNRVNTYLN